MSGCAPEPVCALRNTPATKQDFLPCPVRSLATVLSYPASHISVGPVILFFFNLFLRLSSVLFHGAFPTKILYIFIFHAYYTPCQCHFAVFNHRYVIRRWAQWPRCLRRRSTAARLLRLRVQIPPGAWIFFCLLCVFR